MGQTREELFWSKVEKRRWNSCWLWAGTRNAQGYGVFHSPAGNSAHRASHLYAKGPIPPGLFVLHSCHNPPCVNPRHLRAGTHQENMRDSWLREQKTRWRRKKMGQRWDMAQPPLPSALAWCAGYSEGGPFSKRKLNAAEIRKLQIAQGVEPVGRPRGPSLAGKSAAALRASRSTVTDALKAQKEI